MTPQDRAERSAAAMWAHDAASKALGMQIEDIGPGAATLTLTVRPDMLNGHGICHGGIIFAIADSALAFASNSYNQLMVAQMNQITYLAPGQPGEVLSATATQTAHAGRTGIYDVTVTGEGGRKIAVFRGHTRAITGQHFDEDAT
ncbi:hydroxyphenylacetyl-CoA thioesterase PaaI [uncultured Tateyamaria sp.]|uniref:hydroxyphenylacetyl-CoA thioesterase PaaI n=1 Tax=uncultured Tateyamaria sp. TaxID=455651 RepID=UPI002615793E|nr:hydroxyphenylacetyl-CoA thioesterase PaaI [uncultured Tateyamaria sp.]